VSSELDEILSLSDRILVMFKGRIVAEFDASTAGPPSTRMRSALPWRERRHEPERRSLDNAR
jgi:ABC-type multidrug transport system ATPase subunit